MKYFLILITLGFIFPALLPAECLEGNCVNGWGRATTSQGLEYTGQWKNHKPHGKGTATTLTGNKISGDHWVDGKLRGYGVEIYKNGRKYEGQFKNTLYNGIGTDSYPDGMKYVGEFKDGRQTGRGKLMFPDNTTIEAEFKNGRAHGKGRATFGNGSSYEGNFVDGHFSGRGRLVFSDGNVYEGEFKNDEPHGEGIEYFPDGSVKHKGTWAHGLIVESKKLRNKSTLRQPK